MRIARATPAPRPTEALWERYRSSGDLAARAQLLDGYLGLVLHSARELMRRVSRSVELDDMISAGTLGLVQALEGFEPAQGLAFSTFAMPRIRGAMLDELRRRDWMPRTLRARARRLAHTRADLEQRLGREPTPREMAAALDLDLADYWRWVRESHGRVLMPLDDRVEGDPADDVPLAETIADPRGPRPDERIEREDSHRQLRAAFDALPKRDRLVLTLYYYEGLTLRQIGEVLHVTESRVSQVHSRALRRLREHAALAEEGS